MRTVFSEDEIKVVQRLYLDVDLAVDQLPYTVEFDWMLSEFNTQNSTSVPEVEFFRRLTNLRKKGGLRRKKPR